jgi:hypothetical protein
METATLPPIATPVGQTRPLRDDELPTVVHVGSDLQIPLRDSPEEVLSAMRGERGKIFTGTDFYTGRRVHLRAEHISAAVKAVEVNR